MENKISWTADFIISGPKDEEISRDVTKSRSFTTGVLCWGVKCLVYAKISEIYVICYNEVAQYTLLKCLDKNERNLSTVVIGCRNKNVVCFEVFYDKCEKFEW
jgi:hypothetical protein